MSEKQSKFYLTTPIYYVNARPHIGHAYTTIAADVIARRHRLLGDDTFFLTGTDEHGQKVERSAEAAGLSPQHFTDQVSASFRSLWDRMGITYNDYIRTTSDRHKKGVQKLFQFLCGRDAIYLDSYTGQYCVTDETFVDVPVGAPCPECGRITETVTEENYFFRLSSYQRQLIDLIESGELAIQPEVRKNEVLSFLRGNIAEAPQTELSAKGTPYVAGALKDLSVSRTSVKWGIPVPGNEKHVIYVWVDALINYMSAIGYGSDEPAEQKKFEHYWPADLHLVGKEIIRFHCVYWPALLLAAGLPLPKAITAHGWLLFEESKMSKSRGNIVRTETILDAFGTLKPKPQDLPGAVLNDTFWKQQQDLFAADVLRYFLLREIPFGQDGSFSFDALLQRYNSDLANGYGNLVSRTLNMIQKYFDGVIPDPEKFGVSRYEPKKMPDVVEFESQFNLANFSKALEAAWALIGATDKFISDRTPWKLAASSESRGQLAFVLYRAADLIRVATYMLYPVLPDTAARVWDQLGLGDIRESREDHLITERLEPGRPLGPLGPIFPRAPKELIQLMTDMEQKNNSTKPEPSKFVDEKTTHTSPAPEDSTHPGAAPRTSSLPSENPAAQVGGSAATTPELPKPPASHTEAPASGPFAASAAADTSQIAIEDFVKIDLRVARVLVAERIPKADKLLRLEVDLGSEKRQILSGIAEWYTPEELIGRRIIIIANLAPRKMRGLESHGMLLAASHGENGKPILATFADSDEIALGSRLK